MAEKNLIEMETIVTESRPNAMFRVEVSTNPQARQERQQPPFKKILVALDSPVGAEAIIEKALSLSQNHHSTIMLFHCLSWSEEQKANPLIGIGTLGDLNIYQYEKLQKLRSRFQQKDLEEIKQWLSNCSQKLIIKDVNVEIDCQVGYPSRNICQRAQDWGADLIVIGRRGHRGLSELLLGSVSNYVVHHATCNVLIVQTSS